MIKYALLCEHDHPFEGWFSTSSDFEDQSAKGLIECPYCASKMVRKAIVAPAVTGTKAQSSAQTPPTPQMQQQMMMQAMGEVRKRVEETFDYVGDRFAAEARAIHDGESEDRGIYGEASPKQVRELIADGVRIAPLPPKPPEKDKLN
jgi:hypothetical protein